MGYPSRKPQCRQAGFCGGMQTPCLFLVSPAAKRMAGHDSSHQKGVILQDHGQQDAVMRPRCASLALKLPWSSELGVPTAWPEKPQGTQAWHMGTTDLRVPQPAATNFYLEHA